MLIFYYEDCVLCSPCDAPPAPGGRAAEEAQQAALQDPEEGEQAWPADVEHFQVDYLSLLEAKLKEMNEVQ